MRILMSSHVFAPSVGGIERVAESLATEFVRRGHAVQLVTQTTGVTEGGMAFPVHRRPSARQLLELVRWCDVFFHNNISLPRAWPLLLVRRPWIVAHHVWIPRSGIAARLKRRALRYARGISVSRAVAGHLATPSVVIPNPYDDALFRRIDAIDKSRDLVFVGRLVSDKGADLLLSAVARLAGHGLHPTVTIVGTGPEMQALQAQVASLGLAGVTFAGPRSGTELVRLLNEHRLIVIPSRWEEPFGIVALEGIACGCVAVGSAAGGLQDAIGDCGETFPNGEVDALTTVLERLLRDPARLATLRQKSAQHLRRHGRTNVAAEYLRVFEQALERFAAAPRRGVFRV